ncbi:IclR family transcriptional regulator [Metabacillus bambusae]|uniref:IclR family transcriptional regulator n=1 Tax=Metabacillus bambusae TaxID=2795218 RepID=A0ABS3N9D0_9BACI|nr:IclR family transcriptional regulator [Metabacillus bambusae]MBO1514904.1 IclR family transcriptional regulator [Metabacillus bambusae]
MENVRSVERALELLECFSEVHEEIGLSELSRSLALPKATVLRLARTLQSKGYLFQNDENHTYRLGSKVLGLSNVFLTNLDFRKVALPFMKGLRDKTQETVALFVVSDNKRMCVERVESHHTLQPAIRIGEHVSLERGSASKLLVVYQKISPFIESIDPEEIQQIFNQGFAASIEEREQGLASISAPIYNNKGQTIAALCITGSAFRFTKEKIENHINEILATAKQISYQLGYLD